MYLNLFNHDIGRDCQTVIKMCYGNGGIELIMLIPRLSCLFFTVTIGILGSTTEAQEQFKQVPKFVKKKTPLELFLMRKVSCL